MAKPSSSGGLGPASAAGTAEVARNVTLHMRPLTPGLWLPEHMIDGSSFQLVRERSVIQFLVEVEVRPEISLTVRSTLTNLDFLKKV